MLGKLKAALLGNSKTTIIGAIIAILAAVGVANEEAKVIAEVVAAVIIAVGFFLSKDGDK